MKKKLNGFSIIELIVVMAILAMLMGVAVLSFGDAFDKSDNAQASVSANAINSAVIQTLFDKNNEKVENLSSSTSDLHVRITNASKLKDGETIKFNYYDVNTGVGLPTLSSYVPAKDTWAVYLPKIEVDDPDNTNTKIDVYDFTEPVYVLTPPYKTVKMYADGSEVK